MLSECHAMSHSLRRETSNLLKELTVVEDVDNRIYKRPAAANRRPAAPAIAGRAVGWAAAPVEPAVAADLRELSTAAMLLLTELTAEVAPAPVPVPVMEAMLDAPSERTEERSLAIELAREARLELPVTSLRRELATEEASPITEEKSPRSEESWPWTAEAPIAATMMEVKRIVTVVMWLRVWVSWMNVSRRS